MTEEILRYESRVQHYGIKSRAKPQSGKIGKFQISERYVSPVEARLPPGVKCYQVIIEAKVTSLAEMRDRQMEAFTLAHELDRAWVYTCGRPLHAVHTEWSFLETPAQWASNLDDVKKDLARAEGSPVGGTGSVTSRHWLRMLIFPLRKALRVLRAIRKASPTIVALMDLHYGALKTSDPQAKLFLLAKALELIRVMLPSKDDKAQEQALPAEIRSAMSQSFHDLFNLSNNRFDVRHVVSDPQGPQLHQRMTAQEYHAFIKDADLVTRTVICQALGVTPFVVGNE